MFFTFLWQDYADQNNKTSTYIEEATSITEWKEKNKTKNHENGKDKGCSII